MKYEEKLLQYFENKGIFQFLKKLPPFCGSIKTYAKFIITNEPLINFAIFHKYLFSRNDSFSNTVEPLYYSGYPI